MKKVLMCLLLLSSCTVSELYTMKPVVKKGFVLPTKDIYILAFFINKTAVWYGEADKYYTRFYTLDPIFEYFTKNLLTSLNIAINTRIDYTVKAKEEGITLPAIPDYTSPTGTILMKRLVDYYPLIKALKQPGAHYLVVEQHFSVIFAEQGTRAALLDIKLFILNSEGETVYAKLYSPRHRFTPEDEAILINFHKKTREAVQKRMMHIYSELFLKAAETINKDLRQLMQGGK